MDAAGGTVGEFRPGVEFGLEPPTRDPRRAHTARMAKPNYRFDKRQRELAKQKQREEKRLKKEARKAAESAAEPAADAAAASPPESSPK